MMVKECSTTKLNRSYTKWAVNGPYGLFLKRLEESTACGNEKSNRANKNNCKYGAMETP